MDLNILTIIGFIVFWILAFIVSVGMVKADNNGHKLNSNEYVLCLLFGFIMVIALLFLCSDRKYFIQYHSNEHIEARRKFRKDAQRINGKPETYSFETKTPEMYSWSVD